MHEMQAYKIALVSYKKYTEEFTRYKAINLTSSDYPEKQLASIL